MRTKNIAFGASKVRFYHDAGIRDLHLLADKLNTVIVTDDQVYAHHGKKLRGWKIIVIKAGEAYKTQSTADEVIEQLISFKANRSTLLIGLGGGTVTDVAGYVAGVYMRGIDCAFVPTTLLAMVDAAIGGKNGVNVGVVKNVVGLIKQPVFLLYDYRLLKSLPDEEWANGFAEIIKHACISSRQMFKELEANKLSYYRRNMTELHKIVSKNVMIKAGVVQQDEHENSLRRILNFGHTLAHALENNYKLGHGRAVAIGMYFACYISRQLFGFRHTERVKELLGAYGLPTSMRLDVGVVMQTMGWDKKAAGNLVKYILLKDISKPVIHEIPLAQVQQLLKDFTDER